MIRADYRNMGDDEALIDNGYRTGQISAVILGGLTAAAFYFGNGQLGFCAGFIAVILALGGIVDRLYDLTIRLSRTNELLVDGHDERRWRKAEISGAGERRKRLKARSRRA